MEAVYESENSVLVTVHCQFAHGVHFHINYHASGSTPRMCLTLHRQFLNRLGLQAGPLDRDRKLTVYDRCTLDGSNIQATGNLGARCTL